MRWDCSCNCSSLYLILDGGGKMERSYFVIMLLLRVPLSLWVVEVKYKVSRCSFSLIKAAVSHKLTLPHKTPAPLTLFLLLQSHFTNSCLNNLHSSNPGQRTWNCKINVKRIWGDLLKQALSLSKIFHFNFSSRELQKPLLLTCFN